MSSRVRILLGTIAALMVLVCATSVASTASAAVWTLSTQPCNGGIWNWCWVNANNERFELTGTQSFTSEAKIEFLVLWHAGAEEVHIDCTLTISEAGFWMQPEPLVKRGTVTALVLIESGCGLLEPLSKKCSVPTELKTHELDGTIGEKGEIEFKPASGETLLEVTFSGEACPAIVKGTHPVNGSQVCKLAKAAEETPAEKQELDCEPSGSKLKVGESPVELLLTTTISFPGLNDRVIFLDIA
jgi:hypothetical protein